MGWFVRHVIHLDPRILLQNTHLKHSNDKLHYLTQACSLSVRLSWDFGDNVREKNKEFRHIRDVMKEATEIRLKREMSDDEHEVWEMKGSSFIANWNQEKKSKTLTDERMDLYNDRAYQILEFTLSKLEGVAMAKICRKFPKEADHPWITTVDYEHSVSGFQHPWGFYTLKSSLMFDDQKGHHVPSSPLFVVLAFCIAYPTLDVKKALSERPGEFLDI